jgi:RNA polymerase sigma-70 factor, ECF subfamily
MIDYGERDQLTEMFERYYGEIFGYLVRRVRDRETAEDLAEATFEFAWRRLPEVPEEPRTKQWLFHIAHRQLSNQWRATQRRRRLVERLALVRSTQGTSGTGDGDRDRLVLVALRRLRKSDQEVLRLVTCDALSNSEAAAVLGCSINALGIRLHRARIALTREYWEAKDQILSRSGARADELDRHLPNAPNRACQVAESQQSPAKVSSRSRSPHGNA